MPMSSPPRFLHEVEMGLSISGGRWFEVRKKKSLGRSDLSERRGASRDGAQVEDKNAEDSSSRRSV